MSEPVRLDAAISEVAKMLNMPVPVHCGKSETIGEVPAMETTSGKPTWVHSACGRGVFGRRTEHCPECCESFRTTAAGDDHRTGRFSDGSRRCRTREEIRARGWELDDKGRWYRPLSEAARAKLGWSHG